MKLNRIKYSEFEGRPNSWFLEETEFEDISLVVGRNAAGKTRTVNVITGLANLLSGMQAQLFDSGNYLAEFVDGTEKYVYELELSNKTVASENLEINGKEVLSRRSDGLCSIFAVRLDQMIEIKVPGNQIVAVTRRDEIQHPYLEKLFSWATSVQHYQFGTPLGRDNGLVVADMNNISVNLRDNTQVTAMLLKGLTDFGKEFADQIITDMASVGYPLTEVGAAPNSNMSMLAPGGLPIFMVFVKESDRDAPTFQNEMSQGMFRVLSLIVQVVLCQRVKSPSTVLIDDIGEGLDFDRASGIISVLAHKAEAGHFQLIMSTNDKFVMNKVALKYWQVAKRTNNVCKLHNYRNSKSIFEDFEFTGLSNFDFFSTGFFEKGLEDQ